MKNILVISDNVELVKYIKLEAAKEDVGLIATFDYVYSAVNKTPKELMLIGMASVDLKNNDMCLEIVDNYDLVLSLHCKQIFPDELVENIACINFHPGMNPYNRGWYPQVFSLINKFPVGVTIHLMDSFIDHGQIIAQEHLASHPLDTSLSLYEKVIGLEKQLISKHLIPIIEESYDVVDAASEGNYNSINDFKELCALKLDSVGTLREHVDLLRALTHGNFKNAYYYENGIKIFIRVTLEEEQKLSNVT
tara:strand:- start:14165 stop:14914 length:750 start_codon:yes stop_codon:yes gene_type:complete